MTIEQTREKINSRIWKAIAQSGVDLSTVPHDQQEKLVDTITSSVMIALDDALEEIAPSQALSEASPADDGAEQVLWEGRPFLSISEHFTLTTERIKITRGLFGRDIENFELIRIQDLDFKQSMTERMFNIGDVFVRGHDTSDPKVVLRNVAKPEEVYEILRKAWLAARKRYGLQFREQM
jgi:hypothetical protein